MLVNVLPGPISIFPEFVVGPARVKLLLRVKLEVLVNVPVNAIALALGDKLSKLRKALFVKLPAPVITPEPLDT